MKRLIHGSEAILGMAYERPKGLSILRKNADTLSNHVLKCVAYGNSTGDLSHWVEDEIADYLRIANEVYLKPKSNKPKKSDFISTLFATFGDDARDAKCNLLQFLVDNRKRKFDKQYPIYDVTVELIQRLYTAYQNLIEAMIPILTTKNDYDKEDLIPIIYEAVDV